MQVVMIEDNKVLARSIIRVLENEGYVVNHFVDGVAGERFVIQNQTSIDVVLLDILLPSKSGYDISKSLRDNDVHVPIIMLTSKVTTANVVEGLSVGADDYLKKPFEFDELLARIHANIRRREPVCKGEYTLPGDIRVDIAARKVVKEEKEIRCTPKEFAILEYLLIHANRVVTQQELYDHVFDFAEVQNSNTMEVHIKNLRKKLKTNHETPITTIRGMGYRMDVQ